MQYARGNEIIQTYVGHEQNMTLKIKSVKSSIQEFPSHEKENNILLFLGLGVLLCCTVTVNCTVPYIQFPKIYISIYHQSRSFHRKRICTNICISSLFGPPPMSKHLYFPSLKSRTEHAIPPLLVQSVVEFLGD